MSPTERDDDGPHAENPLAAERVRAMEILATGLVFPFGDLGPLLDLPQSTVEELTRQGKGPRFFRIGRRRFVHRNELHSWLDTLAAVPQDRRRKLHKTATQ